MRQQIFAILGLAVVAGALSACGSIGVDNVVFVTRTNVAVDLDATPTTAALGYKRDELVLEPVDQNGRVLPVLTTVGTRAGALEFGSAHSFATGDAALVLAKHLTTDAALDKRDDPILLSELEEAITEGLPGNEISAANRERIVFTTNTALGLEVEWNTGQVPNAVALGFKRKEFACVPLSADKTPKAGEERMMHLASLLATANGATAVGSQTETGIRIGQTFATGFAATLLATHPEVRKALGPSVVPNYDIVAREEAQRAKVKSQNDAQATQSAYAAEIRQAYDKGDANKKSEIIKQAITIGVVPAGTTTNNFRGELGAAITGADSSKTAKFRALRDAVK